MFSCRGLSERLKYGNFRVLVGLQFEEHFDHGLAANESLLEFGEVDEVFDSSVPEGDNLKV